MALALLLLGLAATAVAGPVNPRYSTSSQCAAFCPENSKFGFETGKTYEYDYESLVKTHIPGASHDQSSLQMHAIAKLEVISRCEMALRLQSVELKDVAPGSDQATSAINSKLFAAALERNALRFAFVSGNVESICPGTEEETWVLNIKRALLSHVQNTMNDFHVDFRSRETDVTGDCPVTYTTESAGWNGVHTIKKTKDVEACAGRLSAETVLQGTAYRTPSRMQSLPLMKGSHMCQQKINSQGVLIESACSESHIFRPFSKGNSGASTDITTKMTFKQETAGHTTGEACGEAKPIIFDHEKTREELTNSRTEAESVLREMCKQTSTGVSANAPSLFGKLVHALKKLNTEALVSLHRDLTNSGFCQNAEKYLHDAVPTLGTEASARLIKDLVLSGEVSGAESTLWLNSLAFIQKPTARLLTEVVPLISTTPLNRQAALAVSSLVNNFCKDTANCGATQAVRDITSALEVHLTRGCAKAGSKHGEVMTALKALGNTGHGDAEVLNACLRNPAIDMEVRVTAINAFRRMGCSSDKSEMTRTFENIQLDSELRINAYLSLMTCPTTDILIRVRNMLENEEVNQVGSFVWTHLTNLMETSSPLKQEIRQIVEMESLRNEFNIDKRKFSRNIEKSYFSNLLNSGASVESNIIFSPESFIPRSASVNLTTDLFGHSVNLIEIGGRVEGLNSVLDDLFDTHAPADANRETTPDINRIDKNYANKKESDPKGSAYIRIFGNEIAYGDFHDLDASAVRDKFNYLNWLIELAKEHTIDFTKSFQFLDTTVNVATIAGFPLRMHIEGNGVTDIKLKGKLDLRNLATSPRSLIVDGSIAPSAAMEITAEMGVDAFVTQTGLRTVDTVHTSTVADGSIHLREGRIFAMDVKMARDKMEIFSAKHDLFIVYRGKTHEMTMPASRFTYSKCTAESFTTVTGLEMCAEISIPNEHTTTTGPYVPFTAPAHVSVVLNKRDTFNAYHFEAKAFREKVPTENQLGIVDVALLTFNTPGSRVNRELTMDFTLNHQQKTVGFSLITPWMPRAHFSGSLTNTDVLKRATAIASMGETRYEALAEIQINSNKYNTRFLPKFELKMPTGITPTVSGSLLYRSGRKIDVNIIAQDVFSETVTIEGSITGTSNAKKIRYETTLNIKSPLLRGKIDGFVDRSESDGTTYSSRLEVVYKPAGSPNNRLTFSSKIRDKNTDKKTDTSGTIAFTSNMWPDYDTDATFSVLQQGKTLTSSFKGSLAGDERKTLKIDQNGLLNWNSYNTKANMKVDVSLPYMNIDYKLNMAHHHKKDNIQTSANLMKDDLPYGVLEVDIARESVKPLKGKGDIKLEYPGRKMRYQQSIEEVSNKQYKNELSLQLDQDQTIVFTADYKMLPRHELDARLTTPFSSPITFVGYLNPELKNFEAKASVEHKAWQYGAEATMKLKPNDHQIFIQLTHPSRTIITNAEMKRVGKVISGLLETKWDATRNVNKKFSLTGEISLAKMRPRLSIKGELFPNRFIEVITTGVFLQKGNNCHNQGSFIIRSSFENFEEVSASFNQKKTPSEITTSGQVSWAPDRKIDGDFTMNLRSGWSSVDVNSKLITPFVAVRRVTYQLDYAVEGNTFRANTKGNFNKHNIGLVLSGFTESQRTEGSVTMTSSIPQLEKVLLKASHVDTGRKCHTDAELTWGSNQKIGLVYNMEHAQSGYHLTNNGDLLITTPFKSSRKNKIIWTHTNDESSIKHHTEIEMFKKTIVYDFDGSLNTANNKRHLHVNTFLTGPDINMKFNTEHEHNTDNTQGIKTTAFLQWQTGKKIQISNDFNMDSKNLEESFIFTSPFEDFETISVTLDNSLTENSLTAKNEIKWPANKISLNGLMTQSKYEYDGNFQLETPFMATQKMSFSNNKQGTKYVTKKSYEYAPNKIILLSSSLDYGKIKSYTWDLTSPFEVLQVVNFDFEWKGTGRNFNVEANFFHNLMAEKVELKMHMDTADLSNVKSTFDLKTPIPSLENLRLMYSHKLEGRDFQCSGSFQVPSYKATFNHEMTMTTWKLFNTKTSVILPGQKIELATRLQVARVILASVNFKSPFFVDMKEFTFNLRSDGNKNTFDISVDTAKKFNGAFEFSNENGIRTIGQLTTPFNGYNDLGFTFKYEGQLTDMKVDWAANCENDRIAGQTSFNFDSGHMKLRSIVTTPFPGYENMVFTYDHEGSLYNFNCDGLFKFPGNKFTLSNNFALTSTGLSLKTDIRTPFRVMRVFTVEATHEGPLKNFKNSASFLLNHNKYDATSNFRLVHNSVVGSVVILLPEEYSITFRHNGDVTNFNNNVLLAYSGKQISGESRYKHRGNNVEGIFKVQTPFVGYEKFSFIGNHQGPANNFQCDYTIEFGNSKVTISDEFKLLGNELTAKLDINTPFSVVKNINLAFNHEGPVNQFKNAGFVRINDIKYTISSEFTNTGSSVGGKIMLNIPMEYSLTFRQEGTLRNFKNTFIVKADNTVMNGMSEFKMDDGIEIEATLNTPFEAVGNVVFKFRHEGVLTNFEQHTTFIYGDNKYIRNARFEKTGNNIRLNYELTTPFEVLRNLLIEATHDGKSLKNFHNNIDIIHNGVKRSAGTDFKWFSNLFKLKATAHLPEDYTLLLKHKIGDKRFDTDLKITTPSSKIDGSCNFKMTDSAITGSFVLSTPFEYFKSQRLTFEHEMAANTFASKLNVITSLPAMKSLEATLNHDGSYNHFTTSGTMALDSQRMAFTVSHEGRLTDFTSSASITQNGDAIAGNVAFKKDGNTIVSAASLTTPFSAVEKVLFNLDHTGYLTNFKSSASVALNDNRITGNVAFTKTENTITSSASLTTTFLLVENMIFTLNHAGPKTEFTSNVSFGLNDEEIMSEIRFKKTGNTITSSGELITPLKCIRKTTFTLNHAGHMSDFTSAASFMVNEQGVRADATFKKTHNKITSSASLSTPFTGLEKTVFTLNHAGHLTDFSSSASMALNDKEIRSEVAFKKDGNTITCTATFTTPVTSFRRTTFILNHAGHMTDFTSTTSFTINGEGVSADAAFKKTQNRITSSASLRTPVIGLEKITFRMEKEGSMTDFKSSTSLALNDVAITGEITFKKTATRMTGTGILTTPLVTFKRTTLIFNHVGRLTDFTSSASFAINGEGVSGELAFKKAGHTVTSSGSINTPLEDLKKIGFSFNHEGQLYDFTSTVALALNAESTTMQVTFKKTDTTATLTFNTPFTGYERITFSLNHDGHLTDFTSGVSVALNEKAITGQVTFKQTGNNVVSGVAITTPFSGYEKMTFAVQGHLTSSVLSTSVTINGKTASITLTYEKTGNKMIATSTLSTPFTGFEKLTFRLNHEGTMTDFSTGTSAALNNAAFTGQVAFKKTGNKITTSFTMSTPFSGYEQMTVAFNGHLNAMATRASITINGQTITVENAFEVVGNRFTASGSLTTPFTGMERFAYNYNFEGSLTNFHTSANIESPFINRDVAITFGLSGQFTDFTCKASIQSKGVRYAGSFRLKLADGTLETAFGMETPNKKYDDIAIKMKQSTKSDGLRTSVDIITPFEGYKTLAAELTHRGHIRDFHTSVSLSGPIKPVKLDFTHKGDLAAFTTSAAVHVNNKRYATSVAGTNAFKFTDGNVDLSGSLDLPHLGEYSYNLKHLNTANGFTTEGSVQTPHEGLERASFELTHEGSINKFATTGKVNPFSGEGSFNVEHAKTTHAFTSSASAGWNTMRVNGNAEFKNENGNMEASTVLTTPFKGWERFQADIKHSQQGRKLKTEANLQTPFRQIRNPSFVIDHQGHWKNFKTSVSFTAPFKTIKPMSINVNHRGTPKDFTTAANLRYGRKTMALNARFQKTTDGFTTTADLRPFHNEGKYGFDVEHSYDGSRLNTKASFETPHQSYKNFGVEVNHVGNLRKFDTSGKFETPFTDVITFEIHHNGVPSNFECSAFVQRHEQKVEGQIRYHHTDNSYESFVRVATPHRYLRTAEVSLTHTQEAKNIFGNLKASYNTNSNLDVDYSFTNDAAKTVGLTLRAPRAMKYTASVNPSAGTAEAFINWDTNADDKYMRLTCAMKNVNTEHAVSLAMICPHHTRKLTAKYEITHNKLAMLWEIQSDSSTFRKEIELTRITRGRETIYDGIFKVASPIVTFEVNGNHKVNPNRRYMTEVNIVTSETLTFRSDIKTPAGLADFTSTLVIVHPRFLRDVVISIHGKIDPEKNLYDGKLDLVYAREKITFTGKVSDESNRYRTKWVVQSSLKHPSNKVDIIFKTMMLNNKKTFNMDSKFTYLMSASNKMSTITSLATFDKATNTAKFNILSPLKRFDVTARRTVNEASHQHYTVTSSVDGRGMQLDVEMDNTVPSISTSLNYGPEKTLHMYAKYASADHFQMEAYHQVAGRKYQDAALDCEIVAGHIVKARVFLRPGTVSDLSDLLSFKTDLGKFCTDVSVIITDDIALKVPGFKRAVEPVLTAVEAVSQSLGAVAQRTERLFSNNQFYTRDIANTIAGFYGRIRSTIDEATAATIRACRRVQHLYLEAAGQYEQWRQVTVARYNRWYQHAAARLTEYRAELHKQIAAHVTKMQGSLLDLANAIRNNPTVQAFIDGVQAKGERIMERISMFADELVKIVEDILNHPKLSMLRDYITRVNEKTAWIFEYVDMEVQVRQWLHHLKDSGLTPLRRAAWRTTRDLLHLDETRINKWAPEHGEIAGQVYIPMLMHDLRSLPTINVGTFMDSIKSHIPDTDWVFWDTLYAYKPSSDIRDWIPPFKSHATIAGNQHYMTFDKKFYEFAGECSYLLARDFIDGTFSVIVNYETRNNVATKKSMTIVHGTNQVEILPDFRVEMNGRRSELPIISEHTAVYRVGNTLRIDNDHGIKITCNLPHDHCTVAVSGWYFGKTAGLLGTYDNEPTTDFTTMGRQRATTIEEFARSWTAGRTCRAINHAVQQDVSPAHPKYDACAAIFQAQTSAFRPCFKQRNPAPFMQMCINDDMCKVASFYVNECNLNEIPIRMPRQCVTCRLPMGTAMSEGQEETIRGEEVPKMADVIFVVSHGECNEDVIPKMTTLANQILSSMKELGVSSVNFGIVGYGGKGIEKDPHSHTMDGHLLNTKTTFLRTMSTFHTIASTNEEEDALAAVEFAANYAFRSGASKSIVLMPCHKCSTQNVPYATIQTALSDQDIKFHMLIQEDFKLKAYSKSPKTSFMYGVDRTSVFTAKDAHGGKTVGDRELRRHTQVPKDLCVALTHESNGSVFNLRKLTETKPALQKRFATVLGHVIAKKGVPATCQRCECRSDKAGTGVTVCHPCAPATPYIYSWDLESLPEPDMPFYKSRTL